jgi:MFS family permease
MPMTPVWRQPAAVAYLTATFVITVGAAAQATALGIRVFALTGHELDLGLLGLVEFAPAALLVILAGSVADRVNRRRIVVTAFAGEALAALFLAQLAEQARPSLGLIFAGVFAFGVMRAFASPAMRSLPTHVVTAGQVPRLMALNSAMWQSGAIGGAVLGGFLYAWTPAAAFVATAIAAALAAAALGTIRFLDSPSTATTDGEEKEASLRDAFAGLGVIRRSPILLGAISLDLFAVLFGGAVALLPAIAVTRLGTDSIGLGWLRAAGGIGAAVVTLLLVRRPLNHRIGLALFLAVGGFGGATIVLGLSRSFALAFISMLVLSAADSVSVYIRATLVPLVTPDHVRGRVMAVENVFIGASNELGAFESGVAGSWIGAPAAIVLGGVATIGVVIAWATMFPVLRNLDSFPTEPIDL